MKQGKSLRWGVEQRLEFIEFRLFWEGGIRRGDIVKMFGVSVPQASKDLSQYEEIAPGNLHYDKSEKRYVASGRFQPRFSKLDPDTYFSQLKGRTDGLIAESDSWLAGMPEVDIALTPRRSVDVIVLRTILEAVRSNRSVEIYYQSMNPSRPEPGWRRITPHAFGNDGFRWHARAFCHQSERFKDFLLPRILDVRNLEHPGLGRQQDVSWNEFFDIIIAAHPRLTESQKAVISKDYGFIDGLGTLSVRKAMLFYVLKRLGLRIDAELEDPRAQHIIAINAKDAHETVATNDYGSI
jgi:hypothetical protein